MSCDSADPSSSDSMVPWLRLMATGLSESDAQTFCNMAMQEFFESTGVWREHNHTINVDTQNLIYNLDSPSEYRIDEVVDIYWKDLNSSQEDVIPPGTSLRSQRNDQLWVSTYPNTIQFNVNFKREQQIRLVLALVPTGKTVDADILAKYKSTIRELARYWALSMEGKDWANANNAARAMQMYDEGKQEAIRSTKVVVGQFRKSHRKSDLYPHKTRKRGRFE